ncbi:hypothetical protein [Marinifilum fragile]|uniref:hypothetical protein n=1 Tax=Marinifilum fragile TaxID=570161 RepID=UPI002AA7B7D2|nr:hypothetical protein [Marinifilum fragile]
MKEFNRLVIKYFLIGMGVGLFNFLLIAGQPYYFDAINSLQLEDINFFYTHILRYSSNAIVGIFIVFDAFKYAQNKYWISLLGFLIPVFGVCFVLLEKYLNQKLYNHGK